MVIWATVHGLVTIEIAQFGPRKHTLIASFRERPLRLAMMLRENALTDGTAVRPTDPEVTG